MSKILKILKYLVVWYELKHPDHEDPVFICDNISCRNSHKNEKYQIPENQPQCPIFKDNRCCGGCRFAARCQHCVNCNCFGFTYAQMGGNDNNYYLHKSSKFYGLGRLDKEGKFDWEYYCEQKKRKDIAPNKFVIVNGIVGKIISLPNKKGDFKIITDSDITKTVNIFKDFDDYITVYENEYIARMCGQR